MHTAESFEPETSSFDADVTIQKLKRYKSPDIDRISAELIHKLISYIWNKEEQPQQCKDSIIVSVYKKSDKLS
jgi:hypothetical protein